MAGMKDEAGPLWLLMENFLDSLPVRPWVAALVVLTVGILVALTVASRRKS
jgi:hypothetical protein